MKPSTVLSLLAGAAVVPGALAMQADSDPLSFGAFSDPVEARDLEARQTTVDSTGQIVINALYAIGNSTRAVGNQISTFTIESLLDLNTASLAVVSLIDSAIVNVTNTKANLSDPDAAALIPIIESLALTVNYTVDQAIAKKKAFGGASFVVLSQFQIQRQKTAQLNSLIALKLPTILLKESLALVEPIFGNLTQGITIFSTPNVNPHSAYTSLSTYSSDATFNARVGLGSIAALFIVALMNML